MAVVCGLITAGLGVYAFDATHTTGRCIELVDWNVTHKNGAALPVTKPFWATVAAGTPTITQNADGSYTYHLPITLTVDVAAAFPQGESLNVYTFNYTVQRSDCKGGPQTCTTRFRLPSACQGSLAAVNFLYAVGQASGGGNPTKLWRFYLDAADPTKEFWRELGTIDPSSYGVRFSVTDNKLVTADAGDRFEQSTLRGRLTQTLFTNTDIGSNVAWDVDFARERVYYFGLDGGLGAIISRDFAGGDKQIVRKDADTASISGLAYNPSLDIITYTGSLKVYRVRPNGTDFDEVTSTNVAHNSGNHQIDPALGSEGTLFARGNDAGQGGLSLYQFDLAVGTALFLPNHSDTNHHTLWRARQYVYAEHSNNLVRRTDYDGSNPAAHPLGVPQFVSTGLAHIAIPDGLTVLEAQPGYHTDFDPGAAYDGVQEIFEDTGATDPCEIGDGVASFINQGVRRTLFTQPTIADRPTFEEVSGIKVFRADGVDDQLNANTIEFGGMLQADQISIYLVLKPLTGDTANAYFRYVGNPGAPLNRLFFGYLTATLYFDCGNLGSGGRITGAAPGAWEGNWHLVELHRRASDGAAEVIVDDVQAASGTMTSSLTLATTTPFELLGDSTDFAGGDLARMLIYAYHHDQQTRDIVKAELRAKYAALGI